MAKQIEDITVKLGIVGFEELNKLRSSFRELTKVTNATDTQLDDARKRLLELKTELGNTTRVNKGLTDAFGALLDEARRGSDVWKQLNTDLAKVRQESRLTDTQITALRDIVVDESKAHAQSANSIREHVKSLQDLRNQASLNGKVHQQLGADIQKLTDTLRQGEITNREHYKSLGQILAVKPDAVLKQWQAYTRILQEGTASADKLAAAQRRLNQLSGAPRILERRRVSESAAITQDPEYLRRFGFEGTSLPELPNTNAAYAQQIKELQQDLANLDRSSIEYLQTLMQLAGVQRQSTEVARGYAQALLMGVQAKTVANSTRNLQEVITALRAEMQQLDTTTSEGSAAYATNANQVRNLEQQLKNLAGAYRNVGDMATQAATAEQNAANARIRANYLNRGMVRQQEAALAELGQRVRQGISETPLLLPAAGQTSAPGTGAAISGGARRLAAGRTETVFGPAELRGAAQQAGLPSAATGVPAAVGLISDAYAAQARSAFKASESLSSYFVAINKATQGSNNSINSLNEQRQAWEALRTAIPRTYKLYGEATTEIQKLDRQLERSNAQRRRLSGMQVAEGVGAAVTGGIFGGPEGLIGGLGGLAVGGVGGAFAGAAFGAQLGMFRQQLGLVAQYVAQLNLAKTTLAQASTGQADYNNMLTAARSISADYAVTLQDTLRGYAQVAVAARANGLSAKETEQVYRGVISAGVAFGKSQADLDAIVTATVQVLSKGKVSAEELGGQIGERLPGAVAKFAAATGRTLPELAKALEDGKVNIRDFVKFAQKQFTDYDSIARTIGDSPEKAGARLRIALDTIAESYGSFLQNSGATFQDAATHVLTWVTANERSIKRFLAALSVFGKDLIAVLRPVAQTTVDIFKPVFSYIFQNAARGIAAIRASLEALQQTDFAGANARAEKAVEKLYPNPVERALRGAPAKQEALNVELKMMNNRFGSDYNQRVDEEAARLFKSFQPSQYGTNGPPTVDPNAGTETGRDKTREATDKAAAEQQRLNEANAQAQIRLSEAVFRTQIDFDRKRFDLQQELISRERDLRIAALTGVAAETASQTAQFFRTVDELRQRAAQAAVDTTASQLALQNAIFMRSITATPATAGGGALTGGARVNRTRDRDAEATGYDIVMPGGRGAPVQAPIDLTITGTGFQGRGAGSTGKGYGNYVTGEFTLGGKKYELLLGHFDTISVAKGMQVPAGAKLGTQGITGRTFGTHATTHVNPMGGASVSDAWSALESISRAYETGRPAAAGRQATGVASQQRRNVADQGDVAVAQVDFDTAVKYKNLLEDMIRKRLPQEVQLYALEGAKAYNTQSQALRDNVAELENRQMLEMSGARQEVVDGELQKLQLTRTYTKEIAQLTEDLKQKEVLEDPTGTKAAGINARIAATTQAYADQKIAVDELTAAQIKFNDAKRFGQDDRIGLGLREGAEQYVQSIGTMREATAQLAQTGIKGVEDAIFSLVTTGTANFKEFAASILKDTARMIIQQMILRSVLQIIGAIGGGAPSGLGKGYFDPITGKGAAGPNFGFAKGGAFAANGIVPFAMGGLVDRPTLFKFANGGAGRLGLMGEAGPEAIMPLRRLPSGRLGVEAAGGNNSAPITVNVSVDANGTSVQGDAGQGEQLGRVISQAVQAELVRQKRPGGLLSR